MENSAPYRCTEAAATYRYEQLSVDPDVPSKRDDGWLSGDGLEEGAYLKESFTVASL
jgi:hypothetical protein